MPLVAGKAVRILTREVTRSGHRSTLDAMRDLVRLYGLARVTVTSAVEGYSARGGVRSAGVVVLGDDLPRTIELVDRAERIAPLLPELKGLVAEGALTVAACGCCIGQSEERVVQSVGMVVVLGIAGACGAVARFVVVEWVARRWAGRFPLATFLINVTGAFALGLVMTAGGQGQHAPAARLLLGTGFLGGYTTFSTLSVETHALARRGRAAHAWANAAGTLAAGVLAVALGIRLGSAWS